MKERTNLEIKKPEAFLALLLLVKRFGEQKTEIAPPMKIESVDIIYHLINPKAKYIVIQYFDQDSDVMWS